MFIWLHRVLVCTQDPLQRMDSLAVLRGCSACGSRALRCPGPVVTMAALQAGAWALVAPRLVGS